MSIPENSLPLEALQDSRILDVCSRVVFANWLLTRPNQSISVVRTAASLEQITSFQAYSIHPVAIVIIYVRLNARQAFSLTLSDAFIYTGMRLSGYI
jgi:hypothetical protein